MTPNTIVQKLWNYCNILRDDGLSYQDYIEQLDIFWLKDDSLEDSARTPSSTVPSKTR
jgi:type I restriction-modification system DNA methylase subunit